MNPGPLRIPGLSLFPFAEVFLGLLAVYLVYSVWAGLDGRYPIGAALVLLVVTALVDALGAVDTANTLAEYVFFLLAGGVVLLLVEHVRDGRTATGRSGSQPPGPRLEPTVRPEAGSPFGEGPERTGTDVREETRPPSDEPPLPPETRDPDRPDSRGVGLDRERPATDGATAPS